MPNAVPPFAYAYTHTATEATTGYFSCEPVEKLSLDAMLARLEACPMDEFLHNYVLRHLGTLPLQELQALARGAVSVEEQISRSFPRPVLAALLLECAVLHADFAPLKSLFAMAGGDSASAKLDSADFDSAGLDSTGLDSAGIAPALLALAPHSPLVYLRWSLLPDAALHRAWSALFGANITQHAALPHPQDDDLPLLYPCTTATAASPLVLTLAHLHARFKDSPGPSWVRPPAQETAAHALEILADKGILAGVEMRHEASLSPIALLRKWQVNMQVHCGALHYRVQGQGTTYGRGFSLADARASYAMEMIERASAYASVYSDGERTGIVGTATPQPLLKARYSEIVTSGRAVLDPNTLPLEVPYADVSLYWLEAQNPDRSTVLVPAQAVYLFCNLDEYALWISPGSTGLAAGNTVDEAKQAALTEIFERDAEATLPFDRSRCFTLRSADPRLQSLLDDYKARGIHVHFQDITTDFGIPCYQCFVRGYKGELARATGASLHGPRAALAALTETPYPYPHGAPSAPPLRHLPERVLEELPSYSLESPARNVALLEALLQSRGLEVCYAELTRHDLKFPVIRALVPGLELTAELDAFSRIRPPLWNNYCKIFIE